ncbi:MAG: branched-chain amino acid aminotransferase [Chitinophagales bacterium]|nr:branched-chain amino acid aminotransferase [Chitinophagales bacterium]
MQSTITVKVEKTKQSHLGDIDFKQLEFGKTPADHMFISEYQQGEWHNPRIQPYGNIIFTPFSLALHYGQTVFEGMKAFRMDDGNISIFRLDKHYERFSKSLERMCMPLVPRNLFEEAMAAVVEVDYAWVPEDENSSLYMRPFMVASESRLGVKVSEEYLFLIVSSPVGSYYSKPLKVKVETEFVRAAEGGVGFAKCGGNYGSAFYPTKMAKEQGFDQVLWTDSRKNEYLEESGTMNVVFFFDEVLVTPPLSTSILDGVTRDSIITLAKDMGIATEQRDISIVELEQRLKEGSVKEAFGAGTAAVVAPIDLIGIGDRRYNVPVKEDAKMFTFKKLLSDIRHGRTADKHGWNHVVKIN